MKILEICEFSAGICGVWARVREEAQRLMKKGNKIYVFSSDIEKGTGKKAAKYEECNGLEIYRFPSKKTFFSSNVNLFDFKKELIELNPDLIITHLLHPHSFKSLKLSRKLKIPCYIVTHAPFAVKRKFPLNLITFIFYFFYIKPKLRRFDKIIAITKWEIPYLIKLKVPEKKIAYVPNGIPDEFFRQKIKKFSKKKILFLGRLAPVKGIETLISAFKSLKQRSPSLKLEIIGPVEQGYGHLKNNKSKNILFLPAVYNLKQKIKKMQKADIFVLPSKREAMPQSLIEAMALGKVVVSSDTLGARDIIEHGKNGFLFKTSDARDLEKTLDYVLNLNNKQIKKIQVASRKSVVRFRWSMIIKKIINIRSKIK